jgi:L-lactate dehydrogenase complex protein LldE
VLRVPPVQLLVTCLVDALVPGVGEAVVEVLERRGLDVAFPEAQTCCGQPAFNAGLSAEAARMAAHTVTVLDATEGPIVVPSGSCTAFLVHHAPELLAGEPEAEAAQRVAGRLRELSLFLSDDLAEDVGMEAVESVRVAWHPSCHGLRELGITDEPHRLLAGVEGVERVEIAGADECCGFGGLFSVEMPEISAAILRAKLDAIEASGAEVIAGGDVSCLLHIGGGLRKRGSAVRVCHLAGLLAGRAEGW